MPVVFVHWNTSAWDGGFPMLLKSGKNKNMKKAQKNVIFNKQNMAKINKKSKMWMVKNFKQHQTYRTKKRNDAVLGGWEK